MGTRIALPVLSYDVPALQAWLEDRAAKGDYLSEYTVFPVFDRGEPRQVRYRLEPLARRKEREPDPRRREDYESLGWRFVCAVRGASTSGGATTPLLRSCSQSRRARERPIAG